MQTIVAITSRADSLVSSRRFPQSALLRQNIEWIRNTSLQVSEGLRRLSLDLRPTILDNLGLVAALRWLLEELRQRNSVQTELLISGSEIKLSYDNEVIVFRIVQEALNNVEQHSRANQVQLTLEYGERYLKILMQDNGKGFPAQEVLNNHDIKGKLGLLGIKEKANFLGGSPRIQSQLGIGTLLEVELSC